MVYSSPRHEQRFNKNKNYLKEEINMQKKQQLKGNIVIALVIMIVFGIAFGLELRHQVQGTHKIMCDITYNMGETGTYCQ